MSIGVRRDMEEKMKIERETLKKVLTDTNKRDVESAVDRTKVVSADNSFQYIFATLMFILLHNISMKICWYYFYHYSMNKDMRP